MQIKADTDVNGADCDAHFGSGYNQGIKTEDCIQSAEKDADVKSIKFRCRFCHAIKPAHEPDSVMIEKHNVQIMDHKLVVSGVDVIERKERMAVT